MKFQEQSKAFMTESQSRQREPIKARTAKIYQSYLVNHILPFMGEKDLYEVENGTLKALVVEMSRKELSASTQTGVIGLVKAIVASAVDLSTGNQLYPRTWNNTFIDVPVIDPKKQHAPTVTVESLNKALGRAQGQYRTLYALLAGTGLRIGEALALRAGNDDGEGTYFVPAESKIVVRQAVDMNTRSLGDPKTSAGAREVDLAPELTSFLAAHAPASGLFFKGADGNTLGTTDAYSHLRKDGIEDGFHAMRRFRVTRLRTERVPEGLIQFWAGHAAETITDRYDKTALDTATRKAEAARVGLGFNLGGA
jgi:integrase